LDAEGVTLFVPVLDPVRDLLAARLPVADLLRERDTDIVMDSDLVPVELGGSSTALIRCTTPLLAPTLARMTWDAPELMPITPFLALKVRLAPLSREGTTAPSLIW
jgi:hypothetical protein